MNYIVKLSTILFFFMGLLPVNSAFSDEIDDMTDALNAPLKLNDWVGFGKKVTDFTSTSVRFREQDYKKLGDGAASTFKSLDVYGDYVDHAPLKRLDCGRSVSRTMTIFFTEKGQYFTNYWFYKVKGTWSLVNLDMTGEGSVSTLNKKLAVQLLASC